MLTRRFFVKGSALVMAGAGAVPSWLGRAAAATQGRKKTLVAIFQRGAADGLSIVAPFGDKHYADLRPTIGVTVGPNQPQQRMINERHRPRWLLRHCIRKWSR